MPRLFKKIALIALTSIKGIEETLTELIDLLQAQQIEIICEINTAKLLSDFNLPTISHAQLGKDCDLIIVVGGDGSILRTAQHAAQYKIPIIGINRGKLGFLTDIYPTEIKTRLADVLKGQFWADERFFLQAKTADQHHGIALNDVVISPGHIPHMLEFEIYINEEFVCSQRADGLIIATPTGSTAYSLSGGGPILHPNMDALVILPMFSHALTSRPIIVSGNSQVRIEFSQHNETPAQVNCDGKEIATVLAGNSVTIEKYAYSLQLIHPLDYNFYQSLRSKLYWGQKLT